MSKSSDKVTFLHHTKGYNCAQSMLAVYGPRLGLPEEIALKVASAFGGGIARSGQTCGLVTGALMAIGMTCDPADPSSKNEVCDLAKPFLEAFKAANGSLLCQDLLGESMADPAGLAKLQANNTTSIRCPQLEKSAGAIFERLYGDRLLPEEE
ncbi:MAG: C-GCAxxG-C-C family protein [Sporomusaceae bacterium]|nr:C-GCAxxG-C-C family protein [Sporomusaceae bacterium]